MNHQSSEAHKVSPARCLLEEELYQFESLVPFFVPLRREKNAIPGGRTLGKRTGRESKAALWKNVKI